MSWARAVSAATVLGAVPALVAGLAGCGGSSKPPVILDTERVERAIEQSILAQRHTRAVASCPSGVVQKQGLTFPCVVTYARGTTTFIVQQRDGNGNVHYQAR